MTNNFPNSPTANLEFAIYTGKAPIEQPASSGSSDHIDEAKESESFSFSDNITDVFTDSFSRASLVDEVLKTDSNPENNFTPVYYPSRFTITTEKDLDRTPASCDGERVSIKELKNSELHVTGKVHESDLQSLWNIAHTTRRVEVITPVLQNGGMEAYVKSVEIGEMIGYDAYPDAEEWMFKYTIDLVSTGKDEYESSSSSNYSPE